MTRKSYSNRNQRRRTRQNGERRQTEESVYGVQRMKGGKWYKPPTLEEEKKAKIASAENSTKHFPVALVQNTRWQPQRHRSQQKRIPDWDCPRCGLQNNFGSRKSCRGCSFANPAWLVCRCGETNHPNRERCFSCGSDVHKVPRANPARKIYQKRSPPSVYAESISSENTSSVSSSSYSVRDLALDMQYFTPGRSYYLTQDTEVVMEKIFWSRHERAIKELQEKTRVYVDRFETVSCVLTDELIIRAHITSPVEGWVDGKDEAGRLLLSKMTPTHI